jgi:hypothetical protein
MKTLYEEGCKEEILARLATVGPDSRRQWGRMNAGQMVCHLRDAFVCVMGERPLAPAGFSWYRLTKGFALYSPMRWPRGVPTRPEIDQEMGGTRPAEFAADMRALVEAIERFTAVPRGWELTRHPLFGEMTEWEWMRWGYLHTDHHLRQFGV